MDRGEAFDIIYLDFAKAFNKVPHWRLIKKLQAHGISGQLLEWVRSWLTNGKQRVVLIGKFSSWASTVGVPQGSVLSPLLFVIFIGNIDKAVSQVEIIKKLAAKELSPNRPRDRHAAGAGSVSVPHSFNPDPDSA